MSYLFDANGESLSHSPPAAPTTAVSIVAWIKPSAFPGALSTIFLWYNPGTGLAVNTNQALRFLSAHATQGDWVSDTSSIPQDAWTGVGVTYDGSSLSNDPIFYKKAEGAGSLTTLTTSEAQAPSGAFDNTQPDAWIGGVFSSFPYTGRIAYVQVFNRVLSSSEVNAALDDPGSVASGLLYEYDMQANANDTSGNGRNATVNSATLDGDNPTLAGGGGGTLYPKSVAGAVTPAGSLELDVFLDTLIGSVAPVGTLSVQKLSGTYTRFLAGGIAPSGSLTVQRIGGVIVLGTKAGSITPTGVLVTVKNPNAGAGGAGITMRLRHTRTE